MRQGDLPTTITTALIEAASRHYDLTSCTLTAYWQTFGSTAGPFGSIGGATLTSFPMAALFDEGEEGPRALVFCAGRLLYEVARPTPATLDLLLRDIAHHNLPPQPGRYMAK
jgi:hypothetical protein